MTKRELIENKAFQCAGMDDEIMLETSSEYKFRSVRVRMQDGSKRRVLILSTKVK